MTPRRDRGREEVVTDAPKDALALGELAYLMTARPLRARERVPWAGPTARRGRRC
jgi:hypothetical protein